MVSPFRTTRVKEGWDAASAKARDVEAARCLCGYPAWRRMSARISRGRLSMVTGTLITRALTRHLRASKTELINNNRTRDFDDVVLMSTSRRMHLHA
jgi:hypothetical protein